MAIEFHCPKCRRLMRTPDQTAGKKGKCPGCGAIVPIPAAEMPAPAAAAPRRDPDKFEFPCSRCGRPVKTSAALAGKKGKCPACGELVTIPSAAPAPRTAPQPLSSTPTGGARDRSDRKPATVELGCRGCGKTLRVPASAAGKKGRCPHCGAIFDIPQATPPAKTPRAAARVQAAPAGLTPLDDSGLTPLNDADLTPLDDVGLTPMDAGLMPLDSLASLDPLAGGSSNPFADPLAGGLPAMPAEHNPYQSPVLGSAIAKTRRASRGGFGYLEVLSCTWYTFWDNWTTCLLLPLIIFAVYFAAAFLFVILNLALGVVAMHLPWPAVALALGVLTTIAALVVFVLLALGIQAGVIRLTVRMVKGQSYSLGDLFDGVGYAGPLFAVGLLHLLIGFGVALVLGIPVVGIAYLFRSQAVLMIGQFMTTCVNLLVSLLLLLAPYVIVDQDRGVIDAFSESLSCMKDKVLVVAGLLITVSLGLGLFVLVTIGTGVLLAMPFFAVLLAVIYAKATGQRTAF